MTLSIIHHKCMLALAQTLAASANVLLIADQAEFRNPSVPMQWTKWKDLVDQNQHRPLFRRHLKMPMQSFNKLLSHIRHSLEVDKCMASLSGGPVLPEWCLHCTVWHLSGGHCSDVVLLVGMSKPSFCRIIWKTMKMLCVRGR